MPRRAGSGAITAGKQLVDRETDVAGDLPQQGRRDVAASVERNGGHAAVGMAELLVGAALADLGEAETLEQRDDLAGPQDRWFRHCSGNSDSLNTNEFCLEGLLAILEKHRNYFS